MDSAVIKRFEELVNVGNIEEELDKQFSMNIDFPTMGGEVFWENLASCKGWRIQKNKLFGNCRILDPEDIRHAFGTEEYISKRIMGIPVNKFNEILVPPAPTSDAKVYEEFDRLIDSGTLLSRLNDQLNTNIDFPTMGGEVFWKILHGHRGWRIQQNEIFKNCRILGPDDTRYAWGCKNYLFRRIMGQPINKLVNYLNDCDFYKYPTCVSPRNGTIVLVHGCGCRGSDMEWLAKELASRFGYDVYSFDYPSSEYSIPELGRRLRDSLSTLFGKLQNEKIHVLTHSMGGLLMRKALELDSRTHNIGRRISQIVMLAPPNSGSPWADLAVFLGLDAFNRSLRDMTQMLESEVKRIKPPVFFKKRFGIIAGASDIFVSLDCVRIPGMEQGKEYEVTVVSADHSTLRTSYDVILQSIHFFETGHFQKL